MRRSETQRGAQDDIIRTTVRAQLGATRESSAVGTSVFIGNCLALCHAPLASARPRPSSGAAGGLHGREPDADSTLLDDADQHDELLEVHSRRAAAGVVHGLDHAGRLHIRHLRVRAI